MRHEHRLLLVAVMLTVLTTYSNTDSRTMTELPTVQTFRANPAKFSGGEGRFVLFGFSRPSRVAASEVSIFFLWAIKAVLRKGYVSVGPQRILGWHGGCLFIFDWRFSIADLKQPRMDAWQWKSKVENRQLKKRKSFRRNRDEFCFISRCYRVAGPSENA